jgi:predicted GNAT superfamily acetyltransferase
MKLHQRAWCLDHGVSAMTWTFDPLVARNAAFNVRRLGAVLDAYLVDFYGDLTDGVNAGQGSDRFLVRWHLDAPLPTQAREPGDAPVVVSVGVGDSPVVTSPPADARAVALDVPADIGAIRSRDPALAARWRRVVREQMRGRWDDGWRPTAVGREGRYMMERQA